MNFYNKPLVTVITSVLNGEKFLENCIKSVANQSYKNIEHIIIDGKSTDNTILILKKNENHIKWISEKDNGIFDAWNKGISMSKGSWIGFLGSDDIYTNNAIEDMVKIILDNNSKLDYVSGMTKLLYQGDSKFKIAGEPWNWRKMKKFICTGHNGALHNKLLFKNNYFDERFKIAGDFDFMLRCGPKLKTGYIDTVTTEMRLGGVSNSNLISLKERHLAILKNENTNIVLAKFQYFYSLIVWFFRNRILKS